MDTSQLLLDALSNLNAAVAEADCFSRACKELVRDKGDKAAPWVAAVEQQIRRVRQASEVLNVALRHQAMPHLPNPSNEKKPGAAAAHSMA